jgi:hypothetical protein
MWVSRQGGPVDEPLAPEQVRRWRRLMSPPENELPAAVGLTVLLGRSDDAAVGVTQVEAFSTGFRFTLAVRVRQARPALIHGGLFMLLSSHVSRGVEIALEDRLLLGIEYADGRRTSNLHDMPMPSAGARVDDQRLVLAQQGGGGDGQSVDQTYWVTPLPGEGPVSFVLAWPGFGIPESRTVIEGAAIRAAAARSHFLWPPQPAIENPALPFPARPASGWFAEPSA